MSVTPVTEAQGQPELSETLGMCVWGVKPVTILKHTVQSRGWWHKHIVTALWRLRQEYTFNLENTVNPGDNSAVLNIIQVSTGVIACDSLPGLHRSGRGHCCCVHLYLVGSLSVSLILSVSLPPTPKQMLSFGKVQH